MAGHTVKMLNGKLQPMIGLGTLESPPEQLKAAIKTAVDVGYRLFDTAWIYGNESVVGGALNDCIKDGKIKREDIFVTTKLHVQFLHKEDVVPKMKESLKNLGMDYVDLFLIHAPVALVKDPKSVFPMKDGKPIYDLNADPLDTWKGMEECYNQGLAKSIGLSNFGSKQIKRIIDNSTVKPMNLQVECHPHFRQDKLFNFCKENNMTVTAYSPLGAPDRVNNSLLPEEMKKGFAAAKWPMEDPVINSIAEKHGRSPAQICLKFQLQRGVCIIPKSVTQSRIKANFDMWSFDLSEADMAAINNIAINKRSISSAMADHPHYPWADEF